MIGKPEWFSRRKYGGWGLYPVSKEGWMYIALIMSPLFMFNFLPFLNDGVRFVLNVSWIVFIIIDILDIMFHLKKDEREIKHEAIAERNAAWTMVAILVIGLLYDIVNGILSWQKLLQRF